MADAGDPPLRPERTSRSRASPRRARC
jgi:hypothetical protein